MSGRADWARALSLVKPFFRSSVRRRALTLTAVIVALLLALNALNVANSYVGRYFMTALAEREAGRFATYTLLYVAVFAGSSLVAVLQQFAEARLSLLWREWLTRHLVHYYLTDEAYSRISDRGCIDNPDQRISEDVRTFTTTSVGFVLTLLNAIFTTLAFAGVLWSISRSLLVCGVVYAFCGTFLTFAIGYRLVGLHNMQLKKEADLRYGLMHVREHADEITSHHGELVESAHIRTRLESVVENTKALIAVTRDVGFFTSGYNYLVPIIPIVLTAPQYMRGAVALGVVTQAAMAFAQLLGAFSIVVAQFQSVASFAAVVRRLGTLVEELHSVALAPHKTLHTAFP
jgi:putative ATP-binding cassette transporter